MNLEEDYIGWLERVYPDELKTWKKKTFEELNQRGAIAELEALREFFRSDKDSHGGYVDAVRLRLRQLRKLRQRSGTKLDTTTFQEDINSDSTLTAGDKQQLIGQLRRPWVKPVTKRTPAQLKSLLSNGARFRGSSRKTCPKRTGEPAPTQVTR